MKEWINETARLQKLNVNNLFRSQSFPQKIFLQFSWGGKIWLPFKWRTTKTDSGSSKEPVLLLFEFDMKYRWGWNFVSIVSHELDSR